MSRYRLQHPDQTLEIAVGFDPPLNTFFAQVIKHGPADDLTVEDETIVWVGTSRNEVSDSAILSTVFAPYLELSAPDIERLEQDRGEIDREPTLLQRLGENLFDAKD